MRHHRNRISADTVTGSAFFLSHQQNRRNLL
jgi:hypothetical protein